MFIVKQSKNYSWPVIVRFPSDDGQVSEQTFTGVFRRCSQTELQKIAADMQDEQNPLKPQDLARRVLVGWEGVSGDGEQALAFTKENLEELLDIAGVAKAINAAFFESVQKGKEKN